MVKKTNKNIQLTSYEDIFKTEETRNDEKLEKVQNIPLRDVYKRQEQTVLNVAYALEQALGFENQYSREG